MAERSPELMKIFFVISKVEGFICLAKNGCTQIHNFRVCVMYLSIVSIHFLPIFFKHLVVYQYYNIVFCKSIPGF